MIFQHLDLIPQPSVLWRAHVYCLYTAQSGTLCYSSPERLWWHGKGVLQQPREIMIAWEGVLHHPKETMIVWEREELGSKCDSLSCLLDSLILPSNSIPKTYSWVEDANSQIILLWQIIELCVFLLSKFWGLIIHFNNLRMSRKCLKQFHIYSIFTDVNEYWRVYINKAYCISMCPIHDSQACPTYAQVSPKHSLQCFQGQSIFAA